ncbi:hypothetical protein BX600DRAFT_519047 [Xylariales sp. PMI_506]|nr:hypothetical protein BX600DRAFT_519047 [Xylariales sp. PMI_506]
MVTTSLRPRGPVQEQPSARYGKGKTLVRVGNGGAGATGLIDVLASDYLSTLPSDGAIEWVCNHSLNTQVALYREYVDMALTYERDNEDIAASEGWSVTIGCAFHDHFVLAGPVSDPAGVKYATSLQDAFSRIHRDKALFHSRQDGSATSGKEDTIWGECGVQPLDTPSDSSWYKTSLYTPADALTNASRAGAYLLTDRSTLLRQTMLGTISNMTVFFEPTSPEDILMNSCYILRRPKTDSPTSRSTDQFIEYILSARGQNVIANYGVQETGLQLFAPVRDAYAKTTLLQGRPQGGKWMHLPKL